MNDEVYRAIAEASSGYVESPAGCGKTEAIVRTVGRFCDGTQLVLTHTNAGVQALKQRFREHNVCIDKYRVDTISGWSWSWVKKYGTNAQYVGSIHLPDWNRVYPAMLVLLERNFVIRGILNSYTGVIVDEYQDCTRAMHALIARLKAILPCRILGDELQGIFDFNGEPLIDWTDVRAEFRNDLGFLDTPHRWIKRGNEGLGRWFLTSRPDFLRDHEPDYSNSPIQRRRLLFRDLGSHLIGFTHRTEGSICIVRAKARSLHASLETALVRHGYHVLEPNDLPSLGRLIRSLTDGTVADRQSAAKQLLKKAYGGLPSDDHRFIERIIEGQSQSPRRRDRKAMCDQHVAGVTPQLLLDLLDYAEGVPGVSLKLRESISALRCILEEHLESGVELKAVYAAEIAKRKYGRRYGVHRSIGSTLLVKGLEFDHVVILRGSDWQRSWGTYSDLYVALTRGAKSATVLEITDGVPLGE